MTKAEAAKKVEEINELKDHEMYDCLEEIWVIVLQAHSIQGRKNPKIFYVCVDLEPFNEDAIISVPYDYFREHVKVNKPHSKPDECE